jgi:hypothetical protein
MQHDQEVTKASQRTAWELRRRLVQAMMDHLRSLLEKGSDSPGMSLRDILRTTAVSLDIIRARVAHQAFAGGPPEAFWPPMRALLDRFAPERGMLVCGSLEWDPAYEVFWEPEVRELQALVAGWRQPKQQSRNEGSEGRRGERCPSKEETTDA